MTTQSKARSAFNETLRNVEETQDAYIFAIVAFTSVTVVVVVDGVVMGGGFCL